MYGASAANDVESNQEINPAFFFDDDIEENTQFCMGLFAKEKSFSEFRETGVHRFKVNKNERMSVKKKFFQIIV